MSRRKHREDSEDVDYGRRYSSDDSRDDSEQPFKDSASEYSSDETSGDESEHSSGYEEIKLNVYQACGLNTMNMFGTGPFITIPFVVAAADPPGPHALIGYAVAAFACMNDSLIWSELGSMWPDSGGSYVYLRELFGRHSWGRLMAFLFVWQIMVSGPMECASGFVATAQYIAYIDGETSYLHHALIAFFMCLCTTWSLYREIDDVGTITLILWAFTIGAILFAVIAGYSTFDSEYIATPSNAFSSPERLFVSLGVAARYAVYDFTGYYDVCFVGKEVQNPRETIPFACIVTCVVVAMCFFLVDVAVIGSLPWKPEEGGYVEQVLSESDSANYIMATFCETHISRGFAIFFTIIVVITIFGSCFSFMIGLAQIPYTAAKDGYFYVFLAHEHEHYKGLSDYSLLFVGGLSTIFCFMSLDIVIEGMLTMQLLIQFMSQGFGLMYYRWLVHPDDQEEAGFSVPMFPLPCLIQQVIFGFIFCTTDTYMFHGSTPLLEVAMAFLASGVACYLLWARQQGFWPYENFNSDFGSDDEGLDHMVVFVGGEGGADEFTILKRRLAKKENEIQRLKTLDAESHEVIHNRGADLKNTVKALEHKEFRIIQLTRKLELQNAKCQELLADLSDKEKEVTTAKMENAELRRKLNDLQVRFSIIDESSDYVPSESEELAGDGVMSWGVQEVIDWWKKTLPKGAQEFIPVVEECHLVGKDLVELDKEMLDQLGIKKLLVMKILKQLDPLRQEAGLEPRVDYYEGSDRGGSQSQDRRGSKPRSANRKSTREYNQVPQRSHSRGVESDYTSGPSWYDSNTRPQDRVGITSV
jgi:amino acid transporter